MGKPLRLFNRVAASRSVMLLACVLVATLSTRAVASDLYSAEATVQSSSAEARRVAYGEALGIVLGRVAGASLSAERIESLFPNPTNYVVQYQPVDPETLRVSFDGEAIERALTRAGESFWGDDRPTTLIWLAVDWGDGQRELLASSDATDEFLPQGTAAERNRLLREQILMVAARRGIPVLFPLLDTDDLRAVTFADVWGGFDEAVVEASKRYAVDSILIGRVRGDRLAAARWVHLFGGESMTIAGVPELALGSVADRLASVFAIGGQDTLRDVRLYVGGITTMEAYGYLQTLLDSIKVIEQHAIRSVNGDRIELSVTAHGGAQRLSRALTVKGLVAEEPTPSRPVFGVPGDPGLPTAPIAPVDELFFFLDL